MSPLCHRLINMQAHTTIHRLDFSKRTQQNGRPFDVVICFDTTGSMQGFINSVKKSAQEMVKDITDQIAEARIGVS